MQGSQGPTELRHRAHVAFSTAYDLMSNLEKLQNRRKAVIYLSSGYDFNPFETVAARGAGATAGTSTTPSELQLAIRSIARSRAARCWPRPTWCASSPS